MSEDTIEKQSEKEEKFEAVENLESMQSVGSQAEVRLSSVEELLKEELENAKKEVENFKKEVEHYKDSFLRERAEFQNHKRRALNEYNEVKRESVKKMLMSIIDPIDSLDKVIHANQNPSKELTPFLEGVELIRKQLNSILEKENVVKLDPVGQAFDPTYMEAIASEDLDELKEETVIEVYRAGYLFKEGDRNIALRTAMVKVGRPKF